MAATSRTTVKRRARYTAMGIAALLLVLGAVAAGSYAYVRAAGSIDAQSRAIFEQHSRATALRLTDIFEPTIQLLKQNQMQAEQGFLPLEDREKLVPMFAANLRMNKQLAWFSYSDHATGRFIGVFRDPSGAVVLNLSDPAVNGGVADEFTLDEQNNRTPRKEKKAPYDPRQQQWYRNVLAAGGLTLSKPYAFFEGDWGLTAAAVVRSPQGGAVRGVLTADLFLRDISGLLNELSHEMSGQVFLLERHSGALILPGGLREIDAERILVAFDAAVPGGFRNLKEKQVEAAKTRLDGRDWLTLASFEKTPGGLEWALVVSAPQEKFVDPSLKLARMAMYGGGALLAFAVAAVAVWAVRLLRRLKETETLLETGQRAALEQEVTPGGETVALGNDGGARGSTTFVGGEAGADGETGPRGSDTAALLSQLAELPPNLHRTPEDLSGDVLLKPLPLCSIGGKKYPAVHGIPLLAKLGQGGMGAVYFGYHPRLRMEVAVKILSYLSTGNQPEAVTRFLREAEFAARIRSPHLVNVHDVNETSGVFFLVMDYVGGISAADCSGFMHQSSTPVSQQTALEILIAAAKGLAAAHAAGVVHRDLKPENILIPWSDPEVPPGSPEGTPPLPPRLLFNQAKLADLGIAREENAQDGLTGTKMALGTVGFMAPEQARDARSVSKAADVFAMGATLYAILTGRPPFSGTSAFEILMATVSKPHTPLRSIRPDVSPRVEELVDRCLKKNPLDRYEDAALLLAALERCKRSLGNDAETQIRPRGADAPV